MSEYDFQQRFAIDPSRDSLARYVHDVPADTPIVMLNLLRFRALAVYDPPGASDSQSAVTGREAYAEYSRHVMPMLAEAGGKPMWVGRSFCALIAPPDEAWDEVLIVSYPDKMAFLKMIQSASYRAIVHHRRAALLDSRLVATVEARSKT